MQRFLEIVDNYQLVLRRQVRSLASKDPPANWKVGTNREVLLLPGFLETWIFMEIIGNHLNKKGYRVHVVKELKRNTAPVEEQMKFVEKYVSQNKLKNLIIISHSKGGIIARYLLNSSPASESVTRIITIASPHQGTKFAKLKILNLTELIPQSKLLKQLSKQNYLSKITNIYPSFDSTVIPNENLILEGASNIKLKTAGHTKILESKETLNLLDKILTTTE